MRDKDVLAGGEDGGGGVNAALIAGPLEVKIFALET